MCAVKRSSPFFDAAPLRGGSHFCTHHQPDKFTGTQCAGLTKKGMRCRVFSQSAYHAAAPLRDGAELCSLHTLQALDLIRCAGVTSRRRACMITNRSPYPDANPLLTGGRFCQLHACQCFPFVRCEGQKRSGVRCWVTSWQSHIGANPLQSGEVYCSKHARPHAESRAGASRCEACDVDDGHRLCDSDVCAACGDTRDLTHEPEDDADSDVYYCDACRDVWLGMHCPKSMW